MNKTNSQSRNKILTIEYPKDGNHRARKVISRSKAQPTGKYPSWKMGRMVHWESPHELNAYRILDADPEVLRFHEQPLVIHFILNGEEHRHYPDVLVEFSATRELWEIKPASEAMNPEVVARTRLLERELPRKGFAYRMVIGEDLTREPHLSNALTLLKHGRQQISLLEQEQLRQLFQRGKRITWASALDELGSNRSRLLCRSFLEGSVTFDTEQRLGPETNFWNSEQKKRK